MDAGCRKRIKYLQDKLSEINELWSEINCQFGPFASVIENKIASLEKESDKIKFLNRYPSVHKYMDKAFNFFLKTQCELEILERELNNCEHSSFAFPVVDGESNNNNESNNNDLDSVVIEQCSRTSTPLDELNKPSENSYFTRCMNDCNLSSVTCASHGINKMPREEFMVYSHGDNPWNFWLQYSSSIEASYIDNIIKSITEKKLKPLPSVPKIGEYVLAVDGDRCVRGQVLRIRLGPDDKTFVMLLDIDSGRMNKFSLEKLVQSSDTLWKVRPQAINCQLKDVSSNYNLDKYSNVFRTSILNKSLLVEILEKTGEFSIPRYSVCIYVQNEENSIFNNIMETMSRKFEEDSENDGYDIPGKECAMVSNTIKENNCSVIHHSKKLTDKPLKQETNVVSVIQNPTSNVQNMNDMEDKNQGPLKTAVYDTKCHVDVHCDKVSNCGEIHCVPNSGTVIQRYVPSVNVKNSKTVDTNLGNGLHNADIKVKHLKDVSFNGSSIRNDCELYKVREMCSNALESNRITCNDTIIHENLVSSKIVLPTNTQNSKPNHIFDDYTSANYGTLNPHAPEFASNPLQRVSIHSPSNFKGVCDKNVKLKTGVCYAGKKFSAVPSHVSSPGEFYIHVVEEETVLIDDLCLKMKKFYSVNKIQYSSKNMVRQYIESYGACVYPDDDQWYRVEIIDWIDSSLNNVLVLYVDYGNKLIVDFHMLQPLIPEFVERPPFAVRCHLKSICPLACDCNHDNHNWPPTTTHTFCSMFLLDHEYSLIAFDVNNVGSLAVEIIDPECKSNTINLNLVKLKHAKEEWDPMKEDYESKSHGLYDDEDACVAVSGYAPQDEKYVCKFFARNGKCYKGLACRKKHIIPYKGGWTSDQESIFQDAFNQLTLPIEGDFVHVEITSVVNIDLFYAVISYKLITVDEETLETLNRYINEPSNIKEMKKLLVTPAEGQIVLAQYPPDKLWYRARVVNTNNDENEVKVFFVDYGHSMWVSELVIRDIDPKYLHLPFQAIECSLANAEMNPGLDFAVQSKGLEYFRKIVDEQGILKAKVTGNNSQRLELLLFDGNSTDIGSELVKLGFCVRREIKLNPMANNHIPG